MLQCYNDFEISLRFSTLGFYPPPVDRFAAEVNLGSWNNPVGFKIGDLRLEIFEYRTGNIEGFYMRILSASGRQGCSRGQLGIME